MRFTKARWTELKEEWLWKGEIIEKVKSMKYLGYTFHKNGNHDFHSKDVYKKVNFVHVQIWESNRENFLNFGMFLFDKTVCCYMLRWDMGLACIPRATKHQSIYF